MDIHSETHNFLDEVEHFAHRKFRYRKDIEQLVELTRRHKMQQVFDDVVFYAKFISNAYAVLNRSGTPSEDTLKLSNEFKEILEKTATLLRTMIKEGPDDVKQHVTMTYLSLTNDSMNAFLSLLYELSWIKNYILDERRHVRE